MRQIMLAFIYEKEGCRLARRIVRAVDGSLPRKRFRIFHNLDRFIGGIEHGRRRVLVISCAGITELEALKAARVRLAGNRLMIVLSENGPDALSRARDLHPSFLCGSDVDIDDFAAALKGLIRWGDSKREKEARIQ